MSRAQYSDFVFYTGTVNPVVDVPVTVYDFKTTTLTTLYDQSGVQIANPVFTNQDGVFSFYADAGQYDIYLYGVKQFSIVIAIGGSDPLGGYTLTEAQYYELNSQIGHVTTHAVGTAPVIKSYNTLNGINCPLLLQTHVIEDTCDVSTYCITIDDSIPFENGARIRIVNGSNSEQLIIFPDKHLLAGQGTEGVPVEFVWGYTQGNIDYSSYGPAYNFADLRAYFRFGSKDPWATSIPVQAPVGDTLELQCWYIPWGYTDGGRYVWRYQMYDSVSFTQGYIPWGKVSKYGATPDSIGAVFETVPPPASSAHPGVPGQISFDGEFFYIYTGEYTHSWMRCALTSF